MSRFLIKIKIFQTIEEFIYFFVIKFLISFDDIAKKSLNFSFHFIHYLARLPFSPELSFLHHPEIGRSQPSASLHHPERRRETFDVCDRHIFPALLMAIKSMNSEKGGFCQHFRQFQKGFELSHTRYAGVCLLRAIKFHRFSFIDKTQW